MGSRRKKIRILVVEDHPALRELTRVTLERSGSFDVVGEATNGDEAVKLAKTKQPDMILLDLKMPVVDGFQALPEIKRLSPLSKVVAYTMLQGAHNEERAMLLGAVAYIDKSIDSERLVQRLVSLVPEAFGSDGSGPDGGGRLGAAPWWSPQKWWIPWMRMPAFGAHMRGGPGEASGPRR